MAIIFDFDTNNSGSVDQLDGVTFDESGLLQNGSLVPGASEDQEDNDVLLLDGDPTMDIDLFNDAPDFYARLFIDLGLSDTFAATNGVAFGDMATVSSDGGAPITGVAFDFTDGDLSGMFDLDGNELSLWHDPANADIVFLVDGALNLGDTSNIAGALYLVTDADGIKSSVDVDAWIVMFEPVEGPSPGANAATDYDEFDTIGGLSLSVSSSLEFDFAGAPPGQNYFLLFGDGTTKLLVSGRDPINDTDAGQITFGDTVNTSMGGGPTTIAEGNQLINTGEGMFFSFVTGTNDDFTVPNLDQNEADVEANIQFGGTTSVSGASVLISQNQPAGGPKSLSITN